MDYGQESYYAPDPHDELGAHAYYFPELPLVAAAPDHAALTAECAVPVAAAPRDPTPPSPPLASQAGAPSSASASSMSRSGRTPTVPPTRPIPVDPGSSYDAYLARNDRGAAGTPPPSGRGPSPSTGVDGLSHQRTQGSAKAGSVAAGPGDAGASDLEGEAVSCSRSPPRSQSRLRRFFCCCIPRSMRGRITCGVVTVMLLVGIALTAYFLFPHVPTFEVQNVVPSTNPKAAASMKSSDPSGANAFSVTNTGSGVQVALALSMVLEVDNPNPYAITIDSMVMQAAIQPNATYLKHNALFTAAAATRLTQKPSIPIGTGKTGEQRFAGKTKTSFAVGFRIVYAVATDGSAADDPVLLEIVDACGLSSGSSPRMMRIAYTADVRIGVLKAFGVGAVTLQDSFRVSCPFTTAQISQILTQGGTLSSLLNSLHLDM